MEELKDDIINLIVCEFGSRLTNYNYNQYVSKLRDYFVSYILEVKHYDGIVDDLFKYDLTKKDIIESTIFYVSKNQNVTSESAIDDFLIALNSLFQEVINEKFFNQNLVNLQPYIQFNSEVKQIIIENNVKVLKPREAFPSISVDEYKFIIKYLNSINYKSLNSYEVSIIMKLLLLYGFSFDKIINLKRKDYCSEKGTLSILYDKKNKLYLVLELPYKLNFLMKKYIAIRDVKYTDDTYLFLSKYGSKITHNIISNELKEIKDKYNEKNKSFINCKNTFTPTGLAKYAVIQMILDGMNQSMIINLTGFKDDQFGYCQDYVNELKNLNRNRYINHMIRGISTYDDL